MKHLIFFAFFLVLFAACQQEKIVKPDTGSKIVINSLITTDSLLNVHLAKSDNLNVYSDSTNPITTGLVNAKVYFYQYNTFIDSLHYVYPNWPFMWDDNVYYPCNYISSTVYPLSGKEYKIIVKAPSLPDATASTTIPGLVKIEQVDTSRIITATDTTNSLNISLVCNIEFTDPANVANYYLFYIFKRPEYTTTNLIFDCHPLLKKNSFALMD